MLRTAGEQSQVGYTLRTLFQGVNVGWYAMRTYSYTLIKLFEQRSDERARPISLPSYGKLPENFANAGAECMRARVTQSGLLIPKILLESVDDVEINKYKLR